MSLNWVEPSLEDSLQSEVGPELLGKQWHGNMPSGVSSGPAGPSPRGSSRGHTARPLRRGHQSPGSSTASRAHTQTRPLCAGRRSPCARDLPIAPLGPGSQPSLPARRVGKASQHPPAEAPDTTREARLPRLPGVNSSPTDCRKIAHYYYCGFLSCIVDLGLPW